jgi:hypothetical protein
MQGGMSGKEVRASPCVKALWLYKANALDLRNLKNIAEEAATQVSRPAPGGVLRLARSDGNRCYAAIGSYSFLVERDLVAGLNNAALEVRGGMGPEGTRAPHGHQYGH